MVIAHGSRRDDSLVRISALCISEIMLYSRYPRRTSNSLSEFLPRPSLRTGPCLASNAQIAGQSRCQPFQHRCQLVDTTRLNLPYAIAIIAKIRQTTVRRAKHRAALSKCFEVDEAKAFYE